MIVGGEETSCSDRVYAKEEDVGDQEGRFEVALWAVDLLWAEQHVY
jgi:hypothetical protein